MLNVVMRIPGKTDTFANIANGLIVSSFFIVVTCQRVREESERLDRPQPIFSLLSMLASHPRDIYCIAVMAAQYACRKRQAVRLSISML